MSAVVHCIIACNQYELNVEVSTSELVSNWNWSQNGTSSKTIKRLVPKRNTQKKKDKRKYLVFGGSSLMIFTAPHSVVSSTRLALHFHPDHLADLCKSGLSDKTIKAAGVYSLRPCDFALFFSARRGIPTEIKTGLCFPYQGGDLRALNSFRHCAR
jgi:hypothetical protein